MPPPLEFDVVRFGCRVTIEREDGRRQSIRLVGEDEADPKQGKVSYVSPIASALLGKGEGDVVTIAGAEAGIIAIG